MQKLSRVTRQFARGQYDARVKIKSEDEIGRLARSFNHMMDKVSASFERQKRFSASAAHELKTPMTSIIGYADLIRSQELTESELRDAANYIFSEGKRLENLFAETAGPAGLKAQKDSDGKQQSCKTGSEGSGYSERGNGHQEIP